MSVFLHRLATKAAFKSKLFIANIKEYIEELFVDKAYAGRISTTELVQRIYSFCEVYSGIVMYPYQEQFSKRVIRSVLENDGAEITALFARQSGKTEAISVTVGGLMIILPQLANMPMFLDDPRLQSFKNGFWIGIFAPGQRQAQITYNRMKSRLQSEEAVAVLDDPDFRLNFTTSNGQTVALSNGSFCTAISASDSANIEGESFKFIICEECQDISNFKIQKCLTGDTRVLLSTGRYKRLDEIVRDQKDEIVCFDKSMSYLTCKLPNEFYDNGVQDVYEVTLSNGYIIRATFNHQFYTFDINAKGVKCAFRTLKEINNSCIHSDYPIKVGVLSRFDTSGEIEVRLRDYADTMMFCDVSSVRYVGKEHTYCLSVEGRNFIANNMISSNSIHPMGAAYNATICKIGTATTFKGDFFNAINNNKRDYEAGKLSIRNHFEYDYKIVQKYNPLYAKYIEREKRSLGENSDAFRMSYCLEWLISRGMFVDIEKVERTCGDEYLERVDTDLRANHVMGIDVGGGSSKNRTEADSTVATVVEVDWDNPVLMESTVDEETGEDLVYMAYNSYIKDWLEILPDVAENYEEQYEMLMEYIHKWRLARIVIDATREAALGQRIQANVNCETVLFTFSSKSKSELYKNLQTEINTGRARFPMGELTRQTTEYQKFTNQLADLQKSYTGSFLVVSHPDERGAHDDFPDSWSLAVWGTKTPSMVDNTETYNRSEVLSVHRKSGNVMSRRNRITARRR